MLSDGVSCKTFFSNVLAACFVAIKRPWEVKFGVFAFNVLLFIAYLYDAIIHSRLLLFCGRPESFAATEFHSG